jgi:periplasmic protein TonB
MKKIAALMVALLGAWSLTAVAAPSQNACPVEYPRASLMNEETGTVQVTVTVGADGKVTEVKVAKSSGFRGLDQGTVSQVTRCKPGSFPVGQTTVEYVWKLS